jgi:hypothetical protein
MRLNQKDGIHWSLHEDSILAPPSFPHFPTTDETSKVSWGPCCPILYTMGPPSFPIFLITSTISKIPLIQRFENPLIYMRNTWEMAAAPTRASLTQESTRPCWVRPLLGPVVIDLSIFSTECASGCLLRAASVYAWLPPAPFHWVVMSTQAWQLPWPNPLLKIIFAMPTYMSMSCIWYVIQQGRKLGHAV